LRREARDPRERDHRTTSRRPPANGGSRPQSGTAGGRRTSGINLEQYARFPYVVVCAFVLICLSIGGCEASRVGLACPWDVSARCGANNGTSQSARKPSDVNSSHGAGLRVAVKEGSRFEQPLVFAVTGHFLSINNPRPQPLVWPTSEQLDGDHLRWAPMRSMLPIHPVVFLDSTSTVGDVDVVGPSWAGGKAKGEGCKAAANCARRFAAPSRLAGGRCTSGMLTLSNMLGFHHVVVCALALNCFSTGCRGLLCVVAGGAVTEGAGALGRLQPGMASRPVMRISVEGGATDLRVCHGVVSIGEPGVMCSTKGPRRGGEGSVHVTFGRAGRRGGRARACGRAQRRGGARQRRSTRSAASEAGKGP
jgi:hypothetical protein